MGTGRSAGCCCASSCSSRQDGGLMPAPATKRFATERIGLQERLGLQERDLAQEGLELKSRRCC